eukprot:SAG22_NODE_481_length_9943_cov_50.747562_4_plen_810_part_00
MLPGINDHRQPPPPPPPELGADAAATAATGAGGGAAATDAAGRPGQPGPGMSSDPPAAAAADSTVPPAAAAAAAAAAEQQQQRLAELQLAQQALLAGELDGAALLLPAKQQPAADKFLERRQQHAEKMARKVQARKRAAEEAEAAGKWRQAEAVRKAKEKVKRRAERVAREAERQPPPSAALALATAAAVNSKPAIFGGNNGNAAADRATQIRKQEAERARQQLTAARVKAQAQARAEAAELVRLRRRATLLLPESATDAECEAVEAQRRAAAAAEAVRTAELQAEARRQAQLRHEAEAQLRYAAEALEAQRKAAAAEEARRTAQQLAAAQLRVEQQSRADAQALAGKAARELEAAAAAADARARSCTPESDTYEGDVGMAALAQQMSATAPLLLPKPLAAPARGSVAATPASAGGDGGAAAAAGVREGREKPLWAATAAELLAELLLRQQGGPVAWPGLAVPAGVAAAATPAPAAAELTVAASASSKKKAKQQPAQHRPQAPTPDEEAAAEAAAEAAVAVAAEKRVANKMAKVEERMARLAAEKAEKAEKAATRRKAAAARAKARRPPPEVDGGDGGTETDANGDGVPGPVADDIDKEYGVGTHAADMRRMMLEARKKAEDVNLAAKAEAAQAEEYFKERTEVDDDGVKWRFKADGTKVKVVRKPCPEGEELRAAVQAMATSAGWSDHQLQSRLGGWGSVRSPGRQLATLSPTAYMNPSLQGLFAPGPQEEQGLRSVWLHLRKEEKKQAKLEALQSKGKSAAAASNTTTGSHKVAAPADVKPWHKKKQQLVQAEAQSAQDTPPAEVST